jgi:hypothetical protein
VVEVAEQVVPVEMADLVNKVEQVVLEYQIQFQEVQLLMLEVVEAEDVIELIKVVHLMQQEEDHLVELEEQVLLKELVFQEQLIEGVEAEVEVVDLDQEDHQILETVDQEVRVLLL